MDEGVFELTKMTLKKSCRGKGLAIKLWLFQFNLPNNTTEKTEVTLKEVKKRTPSLP